MQEDVIKCFGVVLALVRPASVHKGGTKHVYVAERWKCNVCAVVCCGGKLAVAIIKCQLERIALFMSVETFDA